MPRRASKWLMEEMEDGKWNLYRGGRQFYGGMGSKQEAVLRLRVHHRPGEQVIHQEPDGYLTNITNELKKTGAING